MRTSNGSLPQGAPPAADALDCKSSRVVIYAEIYPARIRRKIVNAIGRNLAEFGDLEIVNPHRLRPSLRPQLASAIPKVADQLFFLGVDGDRWLARPLEVFDLLVDVFELGVAIRMRRPSRVFLLA